MLWHRHSWELIDKTEQPSGYEQLTSHGRVAEVNVPSIAFFRRAVVLSFRCRECGKLRVIQKVNP